MFQTYNSPRLHNNNKDTAIQREKPQNSSGTPESHEIIVQT